MATARAAIAETRFVLIDERPTARTEAAQLAPLHEQDQALEAEYRVLASATAEERWLAHDRLDAIPRERRLLSAKMAPNRTSAGAGARACLPREHRHLRGGGRGAVREVGRATGVGAADRG